MALTGMWPGLMIFRIETSINYFNEKYEKYEKQGQGLQPFLSWIYEPIVFAGLKAHKIIDKSYPGNYATSIVFYKDGYEWYLQYPNKTHDGEHDIIFDQILSTFQFSP